MNTLAKILIQLINPRSQKMLVLLRYFCKLNNLLKLQLS